MRSSSDSAPIFSIGLMFISCVLMAVSTIKPDAFDFARSNVSDFFAPVLRIVGMPFEKIALFSHDLNSLAQLQADNQRLVEENKKLREWYQTALFLDSENKSLRQLLNMPLEQNYKHVGARVISDSGHAYVKSVLVAAGLKEGIEKGAAVLSGEGLIGRLIDVGEKTARVLLVTDMNSRVPVVVADTGQHAIMAGANDDSPYLIHLPPDSAIDDGARLVTSGYGEVYPRGIPVGRIQKNQDNVLEVMLYADFDRLGIVRIMQKNNKPLRR